MATAITSEEQLKKILGISNWRELSREKFFEYMRLSPGIDKELHLKVLEQIPNLVKLTSVITQNVIDLAKQNENITVQVLGILESMSRALNELMQKEDLTPEDRRYVLDKMLELANLLEKIDERNKGFLSSLVKTISAIGGLALLVLAAVLGVKYAKDSSEKP